MSSLWAAIDPSQFEARILISRGARQPVLKARLTRRPQHHRALPTLLEAIALWEGKPIRAALVADVLDNSFEATGYPSIFGEHDDTPLYQIHYVRSLAEARRQCRDEIRGMGRYHDLEQLMLLTVAQ